MSPRAFYQHFRDRQHAATEANYLAFEHATAATAVAFFATSGWPRQVWGPAKR